MKFSTLLTFLLCSTLTLSGCVSESAPDAVSGGLGAATTPITTTVSSGPNTSSGSTPASGGQTTNWYRVPMHYGLLQGLPFQNGSNRETGGYLSLRLAQTAFAGSYTLRLTSSANLRSQQTLTYRGSDGLHYTATIQRIDGNQVRLNTPLQQTVWPGENAWNFYDNPSHPNYRGYLAIADFAIRSVGGNGLNWGKHVLLGDSWFGQGTVRDRLAQRLSNAQIINAGIGGNNSQNLLDRFYRDVAWHQPDYVWLMTGTNDYWQGMSAVRYKQNLRQLIQNIEALGAIAVVIDPSVAPLNYGSSELTTLSRAYTNAIVQLQQGN